MDDAVPENILRGMMPLAAQAGVDLPDAEKLVPKMNVSLTAREMGQTLGGYLKGKGIFRLGNGRDVVTADLEEGQVAVDKYRFRGWLEKFVNVYKPQKEWEIPVSLPLETCETVLRTDEFLNQLPRLTGVAPVRMPVRMEDGTPRLLEAGYDEETGVFCRDEVEFDDDMPLEEALDVFDWLLGEFDFPDGKWNKSRSGAVQVAGMVGMFCHWMFPPGTARPMLVYTANQPGSGKSLLAAMLLAAVYGVPAGSDFPTNSRGGIDDAKLSELLAMTARGREPYLWLDDAPQWIRSGALNKFITMPRHRGRVLGKASGYDEEAVTQVVTTGNMVEVTPDLLRRSLICELFVPGDVADKRVKNVLTPKILARPENRARVLGACWSLVSNWQVNERWEGKEGGPQGFEEWMAVMGGIVEVADLPSPGAMPDLPMAGNSLERELREVFICIADEMREDDPEGDREVTTDKFVETARHLSVLTDIVGASGDELLKTKDKQKLGRELKKFRGRQFRDSKGRLFEFGQRRQRTGSVYPIQFLGTPAAS